MKPSINGINVPLKITKFRATCVNIPTKAEFCFKMWEFKKYLVTFDCYLSENLTRYRYLLPQRYYITVPSLPNTGHDNHKLNHTTTNKYTVTHLTTQNSACQIWLKEGCLSLSLNYVVIVGNNKSNGGFSNLAPTKSCQWLHSATKANERTINVLSCYSML